jgi:hypothetical protein
MPLTFIDRSASNSTRQVRLPFGFIFPKPLASAWAGMVLAALGPERVDCRHLFVETPHMDRYRSRRLAVVEANFASEVRPIAGATIWQCRPAALMRRGRPFDKSEEDHRSNERSLCPSREGPLLRL